MSNLARYLKTGAGFILICFLLLGLLSACAGPAGSQGPQGPAGPPGPAGSTASLVITPMADKVNAAINMIGAGFVPGEELTVLIEIDGVPIDLGGRPAEKKANELGAFKIATTIPSMAKPGVYTITAKGNKGTVAVYPLQVVEPPK